MAKTPKPAVPEIELVPDAWAKFEKFVKGIAKAGPQHRPAKVASKPASKKSPRKA